MILVDTAVGSKELKTLIRSYGVMCDDMHLEYADAAFEGHGPDGNIGVGVERKKLHDLIACIRDARLAGHQLIGMKQVYQANFLMIEGHWRVNDADGYLMEGYEGGTKWGYCRPSGRPILYSEVSRYLVSVALSGVIITRTVSERDTAYNICDLFHYFQKKWQDHTSLLEVQKLAIPSLSGKPSLTRFWASHLDGIGVKHSIDADRLFKKPINLAKADESEWLRIPGVGVRTARSIIKEINGWN